jgi:hypothetical protein
MLEPQGSVSFVSGNGAVAAGVTWPAGSCLMTDHRLTFLWQNGAAGPLPHIGTMLNNEPLALSDDGGAIIGHAWDPGAPTGVLFWFSPPASLLILGNNPPGFVNSPVFATPTGSAFAGTATDASGNIFAFAGEARSDTVYATAPKVAGRSQSIAFGLSSDGSFVAALGTNAPAGLPALAAQDGIPFKWAVRGLAQTLSMQTFESLVMTPDASSIVGNPTPNMGVSSPPVRWDQNGKPYQLLVGAPMLLFNCHPIVTRISDDGKTLAGSCDADGRKTGFVARLL